MPMARGDFYRTCRTCALIVLSALIAFYLGRTTPSSECYPCDEEGLDCSTTSSRWRPVNQLVTQYNANVTRRLRALTSRQAGAKDPDVIGLARELLVPPSSTMVKMSKQVMETPQSKAVDSILKQKRNGFFVECGAFDGERSSNSMFFERERGWSGLLAEMDPFFYTQLLGKSRKSWSINACLSPYPYITEMPYKESTGGNGEIIMSGKTSTKGSTPTVPCFPLESLLLALNRTKIDYFSLDVEGLELDVLRHLPFDEVDVSTLSVEYVHGRTDKKSYADFMTKKGYRVHSDIHHHDLLLALFVDDFIFVKDQLSI